MNTEGKTKPPPARPARVRADLGEMLSAISFAERRNGFHVADFLDPLIRPAVEAKFSQIDPGVRKITQRRIAEIEGK